uniref:Uncharacterized protein n=1 Tax=Anguilla anguilla TaxID=7936 RepID=A0A0E9PHD5_ANGAN
MWWPWLELHKWPPSKKLQSPGVCVQVSTPEHRHAYLTRLAGTP